MKKILITTFLAVILLFTSPVLQAKWDADLENKCNTTVAAFKQADAGLSSFFNQAYGYAVFPNIGKGGLGIGGAYGTGVVYKHGKITGETKMTQLSIGFQAGGQAYKQIIFFQNQKAYDAFVGTNYEFSAQASAVAITAGIAAQTSYSNGVAVFTQVKAGLMYEASLGGQQYRFNERK